MTQRREVLLHFNYYLHEEDIVFTALASTTRNCYQVLHRRGNPYALGMGLVIPTAFGLALALPKRRIFALDTDGGPLLSPSILSVVRASKPSNLYNLVFDNEHFLGSGTGPPSQRTDLVQVAWGAGIAKADTLDSPAAIDSKLHWFFGEGGPAVLIAKVDPIISTGDGPKMNDQENKFQLIRLIEQMKKKRSSQRQSSPVRPAPREQIWRE